MAIKVRKKKKLLGDFDDGEKYQILKDYIKLGSSQKVAEKYNAEFNAISSFTSEMYNALLKIKETNSLVKNQTKHLQGFHSLPTVKSSSSFNDDFLSLLSPDDGELSEHEVQFAYLFVETLDNTIALEESGLDVGLVKGMRKGKKDTIYKRNIILRSKFLQSKPNVKNKINELRELKIKGISETISQERLQMELLELYEASKASGDRKDAIKLLKQLGESIGMYTQKLSVENINPGDTLDRLIEMAKDADVKQIN